MGYPGRSASSELCIACAHGGRIDAERRRWGVPPRSRGTRTVRWLMVSASSLPLPGGEGKRAERAERRRPFGSAQGRPAAAVQGLTPEGKLRASSYERRGRTSPTAHRNPSRSSLLVLLLCVRGRFERRAGRRGVGIPRPRPTEGYAALLCYASRITHYASHLRSSVFICGSILLPFFSVLSPCSPCLRGAISLFSGGRTQAGQ
jgi:hypothetical protein